MNIQTPAVGAAGERRISADLGDATFRLTAIEDIKVLKARYLRHLDDRDWTAFRETLTEDVDFDHPTIGTYRTAAQTVEAVRTRLLGYSRTVHQAHTPEIVIHDHLTASGTWSLHSLVVFPQADGDSDAPRLREGWSRYHEDYRRDDGVWRIAALRLVYLYRTGELS